MIERLLEHCAEGEIGGTLCLEGHCGKTVLRERLVEHFAEREIGGTL